MKKREPNLRDLQGNIKMSNIHLIWAVENERNNGEEKYLPKMTEISQNLAKVINLKIQKAQQTPSRINMKKTIPS